MIHVVRDLDAASGGPSRSVPELARHQAGAGAEVTVLFHDRGKPLAPVAGEGVEYRAGEGAAACLERLHAAGDEDGTVMHLHGLWTPSLHRAARAAQRRGVPYLVSTRGMLAPWALAHRAGRKRVAWRLYQRRDLGRASCLVASSAFERDDIRALLPGSRVELAPNGCNPPPAGLQPRALLPGDTRWALAMGRLHPVKGYAELIDAWARVAPVDWRLAIAGPDEDGYRAQLENRIGGLRLGERVTLFGEADEVAKWSLLEQCELFLAPSKTENFGMAIAEALQAGRPVITTTGTPWRELAERDCGWRVEPGVDALAQALIEATQREPEILAAMGNRGTQLIRERYSWDRVAAGTLELYRSILREGNHEYKE